MRNPLRSERNMFRLLIQFGVFFLAIIVIVELIRLIS
jgi:hypothetical protein